mmetsp:Transcript_10050/g.28162  ORF Transcript_10050/g.28162 Transcript_10050/m.28162 type:complete len:151 (+) Transcript_10050:111-563(+)
MRPLSLASVLSFGLLLCLLVGSSKAAATNKYPRDALNCYFSQAANGETICPIDRNNYCIKEETTVSRGECGSVDPYQFDVWDRKLGKCVYRKCAASCLNDTVTTFGDAQQYGRSIYCCSSNRCNGAIGPNAGSSTLSVALSMGVLAYFLR